jgi:hypothetical protein
MGTKQGGLELLNDPVAQELLQSTNLAKLAYMWRDGTPRVVPIWFHWNGKELVMVSPPTAPKVKVLANNSKVAVTIDTDTWPSHTLSIRGRVRVETVDGVAPEYAAAARRYFGEAQGNAWVEQAGKMLSQTVRITVIPDWVGIIDFEKRFPSALESAMAAGGQ